MPLLLSASLPAAATGYEFGLETNRNDSGCAPDERGVVMINPGFWHGRRVFVTGHTGFKGAWANLLLSRLGARICGYSLPPEKTPNLFALTGGESTVQKHHLADIRDQQSLTRAMQDFQPELVLHLAAQSLVRRSYRDPVETFSVNVMGTAHVLEAIGATSSVRAGLIITTDKVYDLSGDVSPRKETDPLGGHDPYSASKAAAEILTESWRKSFYSRNGTQNSLRIATARSGNVIGGGDWSEDRIVTDVIRAILSGQDVALRYPDSVRPWLFVLDTLAGYLMLAERLLNAEEGFDSAWNFGPTQGQEMRVSELVETFTKAWGIEGGWRLAEGEPLPEAPLLRLDPGKAMTKLGWRPLLSQQAAIGETAAWYHDCQQPGADPLRLCQEAIVRYLAAMNH